MLGWWSVFDHLDTATYSPSHNPRIFSTKQGTWHSQTARYQFGAKQWRFSANSSCSCSKLSYKWCLSVTFPSKQMNAVSNIKLQCKLANWRQVCSSYSLCHKGQVHNWASVVCSWVEWRTAMLSNRAIHSVISALICADKQPLLMTSSAGTGSEGGNSTKLGGDGTNKAHFHIVSYLRVQLVCPSTNKG